MMIRFSNLLIAVCFFSCNHERTAISKNETSKANKHERVESVYPNFHKPHNLWTGSKVENKIQYVSGIEFDYQDSLNINYRLTFLEDWVLKKEMSGSAHFINWNQEAAKIIAYKDTFNVFNFLDTTNNLRILFSKNEHYAPMLAKVQSLQQGEWKDTTMVMHQK